MSLFGIITGQWHRTGKTAQPQTVRPEAAEPTTKRNPIGDNAAVNQMKT